MDLSIIIPTFNEAANIGTIIDKVKETCDMLGCEYEIIVVDAGSSDGTLKLANEKGVRAFVQKHQGYGGALKDGIVEAKGKYLISIDADLSHNPYIIKRLFSQRNCGHIIIASRYVNGGLAVMPFTRIILSKILNKISCFLLSLPFNDISSGFRLYNAEVFRDFDFSENDFSVLFEILIKAYINGFKICEIPFHYQSRVKGHSHTKIIKFGIGYFRVIFRLWKARNSIASVDYDERAFYSRIPIQKFWQRQRYKIIINYTGYLNAVLDVGCGTSKILGAFPQAIGLDINFKKLRYNLSLGNYLVNADIAKIPFKNNSFDTIICSEVIEHVNKNDTIFLDFNRVLKSGGILVLGTPDYSHLSWLMIEWLYKKFVPGGYADEHISHYTRKELEDKLSSFGFKLESYKYILGSELICKFVKTS